MSYKDDCRESVVEKIIEELEEFAIEAVVVCDRYSDFLRCTLPHNKHLFNRMVVVTSYEDHETRKLCEHYHVECIPTDRLETRKKLFCKGKGINEGLRALGRKGWVIHLDADVLLPPQSRILLENAKLDKSMLYGFDRQNVKGFKAFDQYMQQPKLQHEDEAYIHLDAFPMATRVMHKQTGGFVPLGFGQLWHPRVSGVHGYPEGHTDAGREDFKFGTSWPRAKRHLIPEIIFLHLESVDSSMSANWKGRKTVPFTYESEQ